MAEGSNSYLDLAEQILLLLRRPMSTREIMNEAFLRGFVPPHLHGRTQWKTLGARLSEDILLLREHSRFYRAHPGRFLLRRLLHDENIPEEHRQPIVAKRRQRELKRRDVVCIPRQILQKLALERGAPIQKEQMEHIFHSDAVVYTTNFDSLVESCIPLTAFVVVMRGRQALSYRLGRYREYRDAFREKRSIGFSTPVSRYDESLFDRSDHGALRAGLAAMAVDLDVRFGVGRASPEGAARLLYYVTPDEEAEPNALLAVIKFVADEGFEPFSKRLAINDLAWIDIERSFNDLDDFDPWSKHIIANQRGELLGA